MAETTFLVNKQVYKTVVGENSVVGIIGGWLKQ